MQLCYRGVKYQAEIESVDAAPTKITARFFGKLYTLRQTIYPSHLPTDIYKYRGIVYQKKVNNP